jgi:hypothetical protein
MFFFFSKINIIFNHFRIVLAYIFSSVLVTYIFTPVLAAHIITQVKIISPPPAGTNSLFFHPSAKSSYFYPNTGYTPSRTVSLYFAPSSDSLYFYPNNL